MTSASGTTKELRLALVCYGGSSLAIYMHGVTKELHRLVRASALARRGAGGWRRVAERARASTGGCSARSPSATGKGVRTRVVVDVVAGTSAGGINGVCLAKALAHNLSLDVFRDLWFERGDIDELLRSAPLAAAEVEGHLGRGESAQARAVRGDLMAQWIYDAFERMDESGPPPALPTLMPDGTCSSCS